MFTPTMVIGHPLLAGKLWPGRTAWWLSSRRESSWSREGGGQVLLPMTSPGHEMEDIILDNAWSKCRFLTYHLNKLYITDLGLDWGHFGSYLSRGKYLTPVNYKVEVVFLYLGVWCLSVWRRPHIWASLLVDTVGHMVVADSWNLRLCLYTGRKLFV